MKPWTPYLLQLILCILIATPMARYHKRIGRIQYVTLCEHKIEEGMASNDLFFAQCWEMELARAKKLLVTP